MARRFRDRRRGSAGKRPGTAVAEPQRAARRGPHAHFGEAHVADLWRVVVEESPIGMALMSVEPAPFGKLLEVNLSLCEIFGYDLEEVKDRLETFDPIGFSHPDDIEIGAREASQLLAGEIDSFKIKKRFIRKDGRVIWGCVTSSLICDDRGTPVYRIVQLVDITAQREAEESLRRSEERYRTIVETAREGIWMVDENGLATFVNGRMAEMLGYEIEEIVGRPLADFMDPDSAAHAREQMEAMRDGGSSEGDVLLIRKDGGELWASVTCGRLTDSDGRFAGTVGMLTDITEKRKAQEEHRLLARVVESSHEAILSMDGDGIITSFNPAAERIFGLRRDEVIGQPRDILVTDDIRDEAAEIAERLRSGESVTYDRKRLSNDGTLCELEVMSSPLRDEDGRVSGYCAIARDVTERNQAVQALRESEERYRRIVDTAMEGICLTDHTGTVRLVNDAMASMLGYEPHEVIGRPGPEFAAPGSRERILEIIRARDCNAAHDEELTLLHKNGSHVLTCASLSSVRDDSGRYTGTLGMFTDITERVRAEEEKRELEAQVNQAQRLEALGRLAGGVAHDFNNLLAVILNYSRFVSDALDDRPDVRDDMEEIRHAAEMAASVSQRLLVFSRRGPAQVKTVRLEDVLGETTRVLERTIGEDIALRTHIDSNLAPIVADAGQLEQVLLNFVVNARDAMPDGGSLTIRLRNETVKDENGLEPGDYVAIEVEDTGCGMDDDVQAHAFEPFFTTKEKGRGTGLGLATVYGVVTQAGGGIRLDSEVGRGTTVTALFPAAEREDLKPDTEPTVEAAAAGHGQTVLVVEDDAAVRGVAARILARGNYRVLEADGPPTAIELARSETAGIDLLLADAVMPDMSGKQLADRLAETNPGLRVLFMSGYTDDVVTKQGISEEQLNFIQKPFRANDLLARVELLLERNSS